MTRAGSFTPDVQEKLKYYVYRLIDPRNGETFYVGKGKGNRVFQHVTATLPPGEKDAISDKIDRINRIRGDGFEVIHVIHRHGLAEMEAFHVEGALIDALPGLANIQDGHYNSEMGAMHADAIVERYTALPMTISHKVIFLTLRQDVVDLRGLYEGCRGVWRISTRRAEEAELVMPLLNGTVREVYRPTRWLEATPQNFEVQVLAAAPGRLGFEGVVAEADVRREYLGRRLPDGFIGKAKSQNPVRYSW